MSRRFNTDYISADDWLRLKNSRFVAGATGLILAGGHTDTLPFDISRDLTVELQPQGEATELRLEGRSISGVTSVTGQGTVMIVGPGTIDEMRLTLDGDLQLRLQDGINIARIDCRGLNGRLEIQISPPSTAERLLIGRATTLAPSGDNHLGSVIVTGSALSLVSGLNCDKLTAAGHLVITGAGVTVEHRLEVPELRLADSTLSLRGEAPSCRLDRSTPTNVQLLGANAKWEDLTLVGSPGVVLVQGGRLVRPVFDTDGDSRVVVTEGGSVEYASGRFALQVDNVSSVTGSTALGLCLADVVPQEPGGAVEGINFFQINPNALPALDQLSRLGAWWPESRKDARSQAHKVLPEAHADAEQRTARALFWVNVERLLIDKHATGSELAIAHELAQDSRRLAARPWTAERALLEASRTLGYSARIARPITVWLVVAAAIAGMLLLLASEQLPPFDIYWDVLVSPVTWIRPVGEATTLQSVTAQHQVAEVVAFFGRVLGTLSFASFVLAARRYLRPS